jgi:HK97 gp10 family phage protein
MADGFSIQLQGWDELIQRLEKAPQIINEEAKAELLDGAEAIAENAKLLAPVHYGILKGLIGVDAPQNNGLSINVFSKANYSAYVEFGTGTKVEVENNPEGLPEYALQFKGTHEVPGMFPRPYFFEAVRHQIPRITERMAKILEKI